MVQNQKNHIVIVAGGSGTRMNSVTPKQFISLAGKPILMHTIQIFFDYAPDAPITLVLPSDQINVWKKLTNDYAFHIPLNIVAGGNTRFQSVKNALDSISAKEGLVCIHDGVRPFISKEIIELGFEKAKKCGSGVTCVPLKDSIRIIEEGSSRAQDRNKYRLVQTPQTFDLSLLKKAYETCEKPEFTDDATVFEYSGHAIQLIDGSPENIKITSPEDLIVAEAILKGKYM